MLKRTIIAVLFLSALTLLSGQSFTTIEEDVHRFVLDNGAILLVLPRTNVPIVNCVTIVDVGATREVPGITGISHYLEHMAFKGTETIGTTDYESEKIGLEESHRIFDEILEERAKGEEADPERLASLQSELDAAIEYANQYVVDNEFNRIMRLNGSKNLNAMTGYDMTMYTVSLPSNKLELWMLLEKDRFTNPVFRQLYPERDVIMEEKRMYMSSPLYRFSSSFMRYVFVNNPYRNILIGEDEDIESIRAAQLRDYFDTYYGAENLVFSIVGDVEPEKALELANQYLVNIPRGTKNQPVDYEEPEQTEERYYYHQEADIAQPIVMIGYQIPPATHPDYPVYSVIADILGQGRSSRLYKALVDENELTSQVYSYGGTPGRVYGNLFVVMGVPLQGVTNEEVLAEIDRQIGIMQNEPVIEDELAGVKRRALKSSVDRLKSGLGLASQLASYESLFGGYTELFREMEKIELVTAEDIIRVMNETIIPENRTIGMLEIQER